MLMMNGLFPKSTVPLKKMYCSPERKKYCLPGRKKHCFGTEKHLPYCWENASSNHATTIQGHSNVAGMAYTLLPVNHRDNGQSRASVSLCIQNMADSNFAIFSEFLCCPVMHNEQQFEKMNTGFTCPRGIMCLLFGW